MSTEICSNLRVATGGYLMNIRWPYGSAVMGLGERVDTTFRGVMEALKDACQCDPKTIREVSETGLSLGSSFDEEPELPTGMVLLLSLRHSKGGFVARFPKDPEEEVILPTISSVWEAIMSFEYVLDFEEEEETSSVWDDPDSIVMLNEAQKIDAFEALPDDMVLGMSDEQIDGFDKLSAEQKALFIRNYVADSDELRQEALDNMDCTQIAAFQAMTPEQQKLCLARHKFESFQKNEGDR